MIFSKITRPEFLKVKVYDRHRNVFSYKFNKWNPFKFRIIEIRGRHFMYSKLDGCYREIANRVFMEYTVGKGAKLIKIKH